MYLSFRNFGTPILRGILTYEFSDHTRNGVNQAGQNVFA